jgi:hypothetical protein
MMIIVLLLGAALPPTVDSSAGTLAPNPPPSGYLDNHESNTRSLFDLIPHNNNHDGDEKEEDNDVAGRHDIYDDTAAAPPTTVGFPFNWRCKVISVAAAPGPPPVVPMGPIPGLPATTRWSLGESVVTSNGTEWSAEGNFTAADAAKAKKWYSVAITRLSVVTLPYPCGTNGSLTSIECQITLVSSPKEKQRMLRDREDNDADDDGDSDDAIHSRRMLVGARRAGPVMCNPKVKKPPELCPGGIKCPACGKPTCACPSKPGPPHPPPHPPPPPPHPAAKKYTCNKKTHRCVEGKNGRFATLAACESGCKAPAPPPPRPTRKYTCEKSTHKCVESKAGPFATLDSCSQNCKAPAPAPHPPPSPPSPPAPAPYSGGTITVKGQLFGKTLGLMLSTNSTRSGMSVPILTMADFNNQRYGKAFAGVKVTTPPKIFPIVDRCICGDQDWNDWSSCISALNSLGLNGIETDPDNIFDLKMLEMNGQHLTSGGIYAPPGAEPDTGLTLNSTYMKSWARAQFTRFFAAGFKPQQLTTFALADEPGWYFPAESPERLMNASLGARATALKKEWEAFLQKNKVTGLSMPLTKRWKLTGVAQKKLFYWSSRFSSYSSAAAFARATAAMETATVKGVPIYVNFNNFAGRGYVPGPVGHNRDRTDPNAAMLSLDWFEFGRARGSTLLWTEDWFGDSEASQWGYYGARLRSACRLASSKDVIHGGYIVPRAGGQLPEGLLMKMMAIVGSGGKALKFYVFGPEYNFPGNCYSEDLLGNPGMLNSIAKGTSMIGQAEELLWPAQRVASQIGILYPRSSFYWDEQHVELPRGIMDCTNHHMTAGPDYLRETYALYRLQAEILNLAVDFVDEDEILVPASLARFKVLYVTEPDLPLAGGAALLAWVKAGGTLITVAGAGQFDRYDEASTVFQSALFHSPEATKARDITGPSLQKNGSLASALPPSFGNNFTSCTNSGGCAFQAWGMTTKSSKPPSGDVLASFDDKAPAVVTNSLGKGRSVHFYFFPGTSFWFGYTANATGHRGTGGRASQWTLAGLLYNLTTSKGMAGVIPPVTTSSLHVEAPLLESPKGAVVTLLNWYPGGAQFNESNPLIVNVSLGFTPAKVQSVEHGVLHAKPIAGKAGDVSVTVPLASADFLMFHK